MAVAGGVRLFVRVTPRARRAAIGGIFPVRDTQALEVRVTAPPADGAANAAVIADLAEFLDVPKRAVTITSGESARLKWLHIAGDPAALKRKLDAAASGA